MPGYIDDIVDSPEDAIVTVGRLQRAVVTKVWPIAPVTTLPILAVTRVVLFDVPIGVLPDRLKCAWPRVLDADVSGTAGPWWNFVAHLIIDDRMNAGHTRSRASRLHGVNSRHPPPQETPLLRLPPTVTNAPPPLPNA